MHATRVEIDANINLKQGEYGKAPDGNWYCCPPGYPHPLCLGSGSEEWCHVTENDDGTISVASEQVNINCDEWLDGPFQP